MTDSVSIEEWTKIETPHFEKLLDHQKFDDKTKEKFYILLGRHIEFENKKDDWNSVVYLRGVPQSGKTLILRLLASIIGRDKVVFAREGENIDATTAKEKLILIDEVTDEFEFPIITTEPGKSRDVFNPPVIMAGNGAIINNSDFFKNKENIVTFFFNNTWETDTSDRFKEDLYEESENIRRKLSFAYLEAVLKGVNDDYLNKQ